MAESYAPGASATAVAIWHGLHRNQIFAWRRQLRNHAALVGAEAPEVVPARLASPAETGAAMTASSSRIEVIAAGLTIRLGAEFDSGDLRRVLQIVRELA